MGLDNGYRRGRRTSIANIADPFDTLQDHSDRPVPPVRAYQYLLTQALRMGLGFLCAATSDQPSNIEGIQPLIPPWVTFFRRLRCTFAGGPS